MSNQRDNSLWKVAEDHTGVVTQNVALKQTPCQVEGLKRCLEKEKGNRKKCEKEIAAFQAACSMPQKNANWESQFRWLALVHGWAIGSLTFGTIVCVPSHTHFYATLSLCLQLTEWSRDMAKDTVRVFGHEICKAIQSAPVTLLPPRYNLQVNNPQHRLTFQGWWQSH